MKEKIYCPRCHSGIEYYQGEEACVDCDYEFQPEDWQDEETIEQ